MAAPHLSNSFLRALYNVSQNENAALTERVYQGKLNARTRFTRNTRQVVVAEGQSQEMDVIAPPGPAAVNDVEIIEEVIPIIREQLTADFSTRVYYEFRRTLFGTEGLTFEEKNNGQGAFLGTFNSWGDAWRQDFDSNGWINHRRTLKGDIGYGLGLCARALLYLYSGIMAVTLEPIATLPKELTLSLNLWLNEQALAIANGDGDNKQNQLMLLSAAKNIALFLHFFTCLISDIIHIVTRLPENLGRFPVVGFVYVACSSVYSAFLVALDGGLTASIVLACVGNFLSLVTQSLGDYRELKADLNTLRQEPTCFRAAWEKVKQQNRAVEMQPMARVDIDTAFHINRTTFP